MVISRRRTRSMSVDDLPPLKRYKAHQDPPAQPPPNVISSLKRKALGSVKLAGPRAVFGIFSKPQDDDNETGNIQEGSQAADDSDGFKSSVNTRRSVVSMLSNLSLKRSMPQSHEDAETSEARHSVSDNPLAVPPPLASRGTGKSASFLRNARPRFTLRNRHTPSAVPLRGIFKPKATQATRTLDPTQAPASSGQKPDPAILIGAQHDSGRGTSSSDDENANTEMGRLTLPVKPDGVPRSLPIEIPRVNGQSSEQRAQRLLHSPDSIDRIVTSELGPLDTDMSMLSTSPNPNVEAMPALRKRQGMPSAKQFSPVTPRIRPLVVEHEPEPLDAIESHVSLAQTPENGSQTTVLGPSHQSQNCSGTIRRRSSLDTMKNGSVRCVSSDRSDSPSIGNGAHAGVIRTAREVDVRSRLAEEMLESSGQTDLHVRFPGTTLSKVKKHTSRQHLQSFDSTFHKVDGEFIQSITKRSAARNMEPERGKHREFV